MKYVNSLEGYNSLLPSDDTRRISGTPLNITLYILGDDYLIKDVERTRPIGECIRSFISTNGRFRAFDRFLTSLPGGTYTRHPSLSEVSRDSDQFFACVRDGS